MAMKKLSPLLRIFIISLIQFCLNVHGSDISTEIPTELSAVTSSSAESTEQSSELDKLQQDYNKVLSAFDKTNLECDEAVQSLIDKVAQGLSEAGSSAEPKEKLSEIAKLIEELKNYKPKQTKDSTSKCSYSVDGNSATSPTTPPPVITNSARSQLDFNNLPCWIAFLGTLAILAAQ